MNILTKNSDQLYAQLNLKTSKMKKQRQYRSNQGRDPKKNQECYRTIELAAIIFVIATISYLIINQ